MVRKIKEREKATEEEEAIRSICHVCLYMRSSKSASQRTKRYRRHYGGQETSFGNTGVDDYELQSLSDAFEAQNDPQSTPLQSPTSQPLILDDVFQTAGAKYRRRRSSRRRKSSSGLRHGGLQSRKTRKTKRGLNRLSLRKKKNRSHSRRRNGKSVARRRGMVGGAHEHDWTKVGSDIIESTLTPSGIAEKARISQYNVGLPQRLTRT